MGSLPDRPSEIPTVDMSPFLDEHATDSAREQVVREMGDACHKFGFFYLVGHGISEEDRNQALECAKLYFSLSMEEKMEGWVGSAMGKSFRGYEPSSLQVHKEGLLPDTKEALLLGCEIPATDPKAGTFHTGPNRWPKSLSDEEFRIPIMDYHTKMLEMVKVILKVLGRGLPKEWNCPPDVLEPLTQDKYVSAPMRLLHYAAQSEKKMNQFGVGDHTDFGNVSVLLQEPNRDGLEVFYPPTQSWIPVPVKEKSYVINMGDMMQKWTAGYYRSARHRVVNSNREARYSVPFFLNGSLSLKCSALDGSGTETIIGEHIRQRLIETIGGEAGRRLAD